MPDSADNQKLTSAPNRVRSDPESVLLKAYLASTSYAAICAASQIGLFEIIAEAPSSFRAIAEKSKISEERLRALLPALDSLGLIQISENRISIVEGMETLLLPSSEPSWTKKFEDDLSFCCNGDELVSALRAPLSRCGDKAAQLWTSSRENFEAEKRFAESMRCQIHPAAIGLAKARAWKNVNSVFDVGGAPGEVAVNLSRLHPKLKIVVGEKPAMAELTQNYIESQTLADGGISVIEFDMLHEKWPDGHDAFLLSNILHDWPDQVAAEMLQKAAQSLPPGGKVMIHEIVLDRSAANYDIASGFSCMMLLKTEGRQRTKEELETLATSAGLKIVTTEPTSKNYTLTTMEK